MAQIMTSSIVAFPVSQDIIESMVDDALREDLGPDYRDISSELIDNDAHISAHILTRESAILCGAAWVETTFQKLSRHITIEWLKRDAESMQANDRICRMHGPARSMLTGERTALNFLQTLSGTATLTHAYASKIAHTDCKLLDTRKTIPGWRAAQKYAVRCGGGLNHRMGLYDAYLIKDNHIVACGSIKNAIAFARTKHPQHRVEVEVDSLVQLQEAIEAAPDTIMLDNFTASELRYAVQYVEKHEKNKRPLLEASGNVSLATIAEIAETGVDFISVGAITKHIQAIDLSLEFM